MVSILKKQKMKIEKRKSIRIELDNTFFNKWSSRKKFPDSYDWLKIFRKSFVSLFFPKGKKVKDAALYQNGVRTIQFDLKGIRSRGNKEAYKGKILNVLKKLSFYSVATGTVALLLIGGPLDLGFTLGREVIVEGVSIGYISDVNEFENVYSEVSELIKLAKGDSAYVAQPSLIPRIVSEKDVSPVFELRQQLLSQHDSLVEAYAIYVDDKLVCAALDESEAFASLDDIKYTFLEGDKQATLASIVENVAVRKEFVTISQVFNRDDIVSVLTGNTPRNEIYTVRAGDTLSSIAKNFSVTEEDIVYDNNLYSGDGIYVGQKLNVPVSSRIVNVEIVYTEDYVEEIPYSSRTVSDSSFSSGRTKILSKGVNGERQVSAYVTKINGEEVSREVFADVVTKEAKEEILAVGTLTNRVYIAGNYSSYAGSGRLSWPLRGTITSRFGRRGSENHTGLDIAMPVGTDIFSAEGGVVTFAGTSGGYGKVIKVSHENGFETLYAHCSKLNAEVGQIVSAGEKIAEVGNTGRSSGPHLHFEVRKGGVPLNPEMFLGN